MCIMQIPGFEGLKGHLPDYSEKRVKRLIARLPGLLLGVMVGSFILDYFSLICYLPKSI